MYTIFDEKEAKYIKVAEPDAALTYTYADYLQWRFIERLELLRGKIFRMSGPGTRHQIISGRFFAWLFNHLEGQRCRVFSAPFDVRLPQKGRIQDDEITTVVQPDLCVVCEEAKLDDRGCCGAPDLVVEILSPGNSVKEVLLKHDLYEEAGVSEYWVVNPSEDKVVVYTRYPSSQKFTKQTVYGSGDIVASVAVDGFELRVSRLFAK